MLRERFDPLHLWLGPAGFVVALTATTLAAGLLADLVPSFGWRADDTWTTVLVTAAQNLVFVASAVGFTRVAGPGVARRLGLEPAPLAPSLKTLLVIGLTFYAFLLLYGALVRPGTPQTILDDLGARETTAQMAISAVLIVAVAPFTEEILFRGLFYGALRSRLRPLVAAAIVSTIFALLHVSNARTLLLVPPLIVLGIAFCLLYERTGSLYPAIALHVVNNAIAFVGTIDDETGELIGIACAVAALATCALVPAAQRRTRRRSAGVQLLQGAQNRS